MTAQQLHILQHSLGVDSHGQGRRYRNHFVTGPGSTDFPVCQSLANLGLMIDHGAKTLAGGDHCFTVTSLGEQAMVENSPPPPKLSRSQQRYRKWLKVADAFPNWKFGDYIKNERRLKEAIT